MTVTETSIDDAVRNSDAPKKVTHELLQSWLESNGPVALHLRQKLLPVEGEGAVIFPPTYADIGYNIDTLADGTRVATIDTVGSQANRLEPIFKKALDGEPENQLASLVPQIEIVLHGGKKKGAAQHEEKRSLLDLAHRGADAVVLASPTLSEAFAKAFEELRRTGNAATLCALAPTSLVFGVWDSRGGSGEKRPRLVRALIRAWDVETLHSAAQFNSAWKALSEEQQEALEKEAKSKKVKLSEKGFADAPATFRKLGNSAGKYVPEFRDGAANPERRVLGGVLAKGAIERDVTVNLVALRGLRGKDTDETKQLRRYLLGLSLIAATADIDLFLREGCLLRYGNEDVWNQVPRRGTPSPVDLASEEAHKIILKYTQDATKHFKQHWPTKLEHNFDLAEAKKLLAKKDDTESPPGEEG
jgi:CRISPR-associated protein Csb1